MYAVFGLLGMLGGVISLIALVVSAAMKKPKKKWLISLAAFFLIFAVAFILTPSSSRDEQTQFAPQIEATPDTNNTAPATESEQACIHDWRQISREEPTEEKQGISHQQCAICGGTRDWFIPKLEHKVTYDEIYHAYKKNELAADDKYQGNRYEITAKINGMTNDGLLNLTGGATLTLEIQVDNTTVFFYAKFEKDQEDVLKKVSVGDTITFEGECRDAGNWTDCELIF